MRNIRGGVTARGDKWIRAVTVLAVVVTLGLAVLGIPPWRDVVFTLGPLGYAYSDCYFPGIYDRVLLVWVLLIDNDYPTATPVSHMVPLRGYMIGTTLLLSLTLFTCFATTSDSVMSRHLVLQFLAAGFNSYDKTLKCEAPTGCEADMAQLDAAIAAAIEANQGITLTAHLGESETSPDLLETRLQRARWYIEDERKSTVEVNYRRGRSKSGLGAIEILVGERLVGTLLLRRNDLFLTNCPG